MRYSPVVTEGPQLGIDVHVGEINVLQTCDRTGILALTDLCHWEQFGVLQAMQRFPLGMLLPHAM